MESLYLLERRKRMLGILPEKKEIKNIQSFSEKRKKANKDYKKIAKAYLIAHPKCEVRGCNKISEEIHHKRGRVGDLLLNDKFFLAVCRDCHREIEQSPTWAKEQGYSLSRLK